MSFILLCRFSEYINDSNCLYILSQIHWSECNVWKYSLCTLSLSRLAETCIPPRMRVAKIRHWIRGKQEVLAFSCQHVQGFSDTPDALQRDYGLRPPLWLSATCRPSILGGKLRGYPRPRERANFHIIHLRLNDDTLHIQVKVTWNQLERSEQPLLRLNCFTKPEIGAAREMYPLGAHENFVKMKHCKCKNHAN